MTADASIVTNQLSKHYAGTKVYALKDLSISVGAGEVYGFLGPNGAGKSTTIRLLMNFIQPTSGSGRILGKDIVRESVAIKRSVGYLSSDMAMYPKLTTEQYLDYMASLQPATDDGYRHKLMRQLHVEPGKRLGDLSRGNRQKVAIVQAFMHKPSVLILDEPSSGLDPLMQEAFYELLRESRARGAAVFMSSHIMSEVQKVCDRVGIIRDGQLLVERNINEMEQEAAHTLEIRFANKPPIRELERLAGVQLTAHNEHEVTVHLQGKLGPLLSVLSRHDVTQLEVRQLDLEELFMHFYNGGKHS
ncbi:MAG TPA: ABC transporter ATP-binding protein [Candidatus Saccharimonadales bacterium]|nr:ABC transporter ATP-binding protein [Candidatus Saccharimonadales bacterium]